jgi:hypothetical protein
MKIAFLGWGSLVWNPGELLVRGEWFKDGPFLPIEFCRQSDNDRLTLVIAPGKPELRTLWALSSTPKLDEAIKSLQDREGLRGDRKDKNTGVWPTDARYGEASQNIITWAVEKALDAVVWTALPPRCDKKERCPSEAQAVRHLRSLSHEKKRVAEEYIRRTPIQIDTDFRRRFEHEFGWKPMA